MEKSNALIAEKDKKISELKIQSAESGRRIVTLVTERIELEITMIRMIGYIERRKDVSSEALELMQRIRSMLTLLSIEITVGGS